MPELKDMSSPPSQRKEEERVYGYEEKIPEYPTGLKIRVEDAQVKALKLDGMPEAGQYLTLTARVRVAGAQIERLVDGDKRSLDLQIVAMDLGPDVKRYAEDSIYPKD